MAEVGQRHVDIAHLDPDGRKTFRLGPVAGNVALALPVTDEVKAGWPMAGRLMQISRSLAHDKARAERMVQLSALAAQRNYGMVVYLAFTNFGLPESTVRFLVASECHEAEQA
jgi:hypothetical protein